SRSRKNSRWNSTRQWSAEIRHRQHEQNAKGQSEDRNPQKVHPAPYTRRRCYWCGRRLLSNLQVPMSHDLTEFIVFFAIKLFLGAIGVWLVGTSLRRGENHSRSQ